MTKMNKIESLWPSLDEIGPPSFVAPVTILREQAEAVRVLTQNIIEGQVIPEAILKNVPVQLKPGDEITRDSLLKLEKVTNNLGTSFRAETREIIEIDDRVKFSLYLRLPTFNGSRKKIISIEHDISHVYPTVVNSIAKSQNPIEAVDEDSFKKILHEVFHSEEMRAVLQSFLAQSGYQQAA